MIKEESISGYHLPWETLESIIHGVSSIDLSSVPITDRADAEQFILNYGYNMRRVEDRDEINITLEEAIRFVEDHLLDYSDEWVAFGEPPSPASKIPAEVLKNKDILDLLLLSSWGESPYRDWACAILKVMHTMLHIKNGPLYQYFDIAREQILYRFYAILEQQSDGTYLLGKPGSRQLQIFGFETKDQKTRESILIKLLCKKENVAEEVHDLIGVRFITNTPAEALIAVDILRESRVILFPNIIPSRSRNTLIDLNGFKQQYEEVLHEPDALQHLLETFPRKENDGAGFSKHNPSSSSNYHSLHITCRQLIRNQPDENQRPELRFFFPYEIQVLDRTSYLESKEGSSAHRTYKLRQFANARRRVLGNLLKAPSTGV